jgi:hypothetical protein
MDKIVEKSKIPVEQGESELKKWWILQERFQHNHLLTQTHQELSKAALLKFLIVL